MEFNQREEVIRQAAKITSLRENIASLQTELRQAETDFDRILAATTAIPIAPPAVNSLAAAHFAERDADKSMNQLIIDLLRLNSPDDMDAEELAARLPSNTNITSVRSALARLADQEKIRRTTRGRYASAEDPRISSAAMAS